MSGGKLYIVAIIQMYEIPIFFNLSHFMRVVLDKNCKYNITNCHCHISMIIKIVGEYEKRCNI